MPSIRVAIIGAGPVGLMLARLLLNHPNIEIVVFESEKSKDTRQQGGSLDLHPDTGLVALKAGGLYDEFLQHARFDGEAFKLCDKNLTQFVNVGGTKAGSSRGRPEIDRASLREILLNSIPNRIIRWGYRLRTVDEKHNLIFDQGTESGFDLIVGADGAWSKVRRLVSDRTPDYAGLAGFSWTIPNAKHTAPQCYEFTNCGSMFAFSDGKSILSQYVGDGSINFYTLTLQPENWQKNSAYDLEDPEGIRKATLKEFSTWHPQLREYILHGKDPAARPLYMLPVGWKWKCRSGVTLIGDAAHVMTPYAGEGVNLGLQDALKLSQAIIKAASSSSIEGPTLENEIKAFEDDMFVRAKRTAECALDILNWTMFTDGTPRTVVEPVILRLLSFNMGPIASLFLYPVLAAAVYSYFCVFKVFH
jgi:2-polyprenyl-6-methoxyphenol hydroxylase-like FAD-dependent oxidoreductase